MSSQFFLKINFNVIFVKITFTQQSSEHFWGAYGIAKNVKIGTMEVNSKKYVYEKRASMDLKIRWKTNVLFVFKEVLFILNCEI